MTAPTVRLAVFQPVSLCNLDCRYCYVAGRRDPERMSDETLEAAIRAVLTSQLLDTHVELLWHAGEPLVAGIDYYERAFSLVDRYRPEKVSVGLSVQTNGTLLNDEWTALFAEHGVSVGVSIDGPAWLHDLQRRTWSGRGTHAQAMRGLGILLQAGMRVGALCVLTRDSLDVPDEIYDFFVGAGVSSVAFNVEETEGVHRRSSLAGRPPLAAYRRFVRRLWERWRADPERLHIREFDRTLRVVRERTSDPTWRPVPDDTVGFRNLTIDKHGNVTTFSPELANGPQAERFVLGNVRTQSLDELASTPRYLELAAEVAAGVAACAETCGYFELCGAGFVSNKFFEHGTVTATETVSCLLHRQRLIDVVVAQLAAETRRRRRTGATREGAPVGAPSR